MKVFPNLVSSVITILIDVFQNNQQADKILGTVLKSNPKWGSRDRKFIAENVYSVVRWYRLYYEILGKIPQNNEDWWHILGIHWILQGENISSIENLKDLNANQVIDKKNEYQNSLKIKESIPDWLDELGKNELGVLWEPNICALNQQQQVYLRINQIKSGKNLIITELQKHQIPFELINENSILLKSRPKLELFETYKNGYFEIQDLGSQQIATFLPVKPGITIIDACAGAGGKSLHLAELIKNQGIIISMDIYRHKLDELQKRAKRAGISCIKTHWINNENAIQPYIEKAESLLLDVPCSGLGVLRRNPDAKWKLNSKFIDDIKITQQKILRLYSKMLKPGGNLVYATCSILPSENQKQIEQFLNSNEGKTFKFIKELSILPYESNTDGFYMALLKKLD